MQRFSLFENLIFFVIRNIQKDFSRFFNFRKTRNLIKKSINFNANCQNNMRYKPYLFIGRYI
jgi:hypothetical protein